MSSRCESRVTPPTASSACHDECLAGLREIVKLLTRFRVVDDCADRHGQFYVVAFAPGAVTSFAVATALGGMLRVEPKVKKGVVMLARFEDDVAAAPSIPAAWASARHILLAPERKTAIAAIAGLYRDNNFVDEHVNRTVTAGQPVRPEVKRIFLLGGDDVDELAEPATVAELHRTADGGEKRIVLAETHVLARFDSGAALTNNNGPAGYNFARKLLYTQTLRV